MHAIFPKYVYGMIGVYQRQKALSQLQENKAQTNDEPPTILPQWGGK